MSTPNDPLFGSTPKEIVDKVKDGSYAAEVLARSDEAVLVEADQVSNPNLQAQQAARAPQPAPANPNT